MIRSAIQRLVDGESLTRGEAAGVMEEIMTGEATPAQLGAFVTALRLKGETVEEIAGFAQTMRAHALAVRADRPVVDTCGTGGDARGTFNISTAAALVAAAAGVAVAKHGNRSLSGVCGSADVLEALGVNVNLTPEQVSDCLMELGIGFMFAPLFHPAMRHAAGPRRELGIRTVFNLLGPLTNPAGARYQVLGVPDAGLAARLAGALHLLGSEHALVVHGLDGVDEITITGPSLVFEVRPHAVREFSVAPEDFGFQRVPLAAIRGGAPEVNARLIREVLAGRPGPGRHVVIMNAAAALVVGQQAGDLVEGVGMALAAIDDGRAQRLLARLVEYTRSAAPPC